MDAQHRLLNAMADLVDQGAIRSTVQAKLGPICAANLQARAAGERQSWARSCWRVS
jgi:hypothetical protein